ncbi:MAG TPA: S53 family peptidase [Actinomycetota bacterium]|nr:S53 family peptidase [Actinomycetota bacterium]
MLVAPWLTGTSSAQGRVTLRGSRPTWASHARVVGAAATSGKVGVRVYLAPRGGQAALERAVLAVSTPGSAQYRRFVTPAQYRAQYGPTSAEVASVSSWLRASGLRVTGVAFGNRYVSAAGSVADAQSAFGAHLAMYSVQGKAARSPTTDISVPASVAGSVLGVTGLDNGPQLMKPNGASPFPPPPGFHNARPCSLWYGQIKARFQADNQTKLPKFEGQVLPYAICGYVPSQFRSAYGVDDSRLTGAGATVAITDAYASPTVLEDANRYATDNGDGAFGTGQFSQSFPSEPYRLGRVCDASGWYGEESLDVEAVHGMAPDANVIYYGARSCSNSDLLDAMARVVDDNKASIVTNSWGSPSMFETTGSIRANEQVFLQGAMQGIGFMFSSGDNGDDQGLTGLKQTEFPTSDPWVTSVGGTNTQIGIAGTLDSVTGWGVVKYTLKPSGKGWHLLGFTSGSGGGFSTLSNRPSYQEGVVPTNAPPGRAVPDVAMDADTTTGMLIGLTQTFPEGAHYDTYRVGGTSVASPLFAGMQADATQAAGERLGFANPAIYDLARTQPHVYTDVLSVPGANVRPDYANLLNPTDGIVYSVRTFDEDSSLTTGPGWDDVTGIGSPNVRYLDSYKKP